MTDTAHFHQIVQERGVTNIIHLAAILSALAERDHSVALSVNNQGTINALEAAKKFNCQAYIPSTIAVFGSHCPLKSTPADVILQPSTIYGVTKVFGELLGMYYRDKFGVDYRAIRYPGIMSSEKFAFPPKPQNPKPQNPTTLNIQD